MNTYSENNMNFQEAPRNKTAYLSSATDLSLTQNRVTLQAGTYTVNMPPVSEATGLHFSFQTDSGATVTLADPHGSIDWQGDFTLDAANDGLLLFSDGRKWWVLDNDIS